MNNPVSKPFWRSLTVNFNAVVVGAGVCVAYFNSEEARTILNVLPPNARAKVNTGLVTVGAIVSLIGAINIALRKRTTGRPITFHS
jgi:hypothetical protein